MNNSRSSIQFLGDHPVFVDGFPKECERSCNGSLHLYPRKVTEVSADELAYLKEKRSDVFRHVRVTHSPREKKEVAQPAPVEQPKHEAQPEQVKDEPQEDTSFEKKWKKKGKGSEGV